MNKEKGRSYLWGDIKITGSASGPITSNFTMLKCMAMGYAIEGTDLYHNEALAADIIEAFTWLLDKYYNEKVTSYDNWYDWQIGIPTQLADVSTCMYEVFPDKLKKRIADSYLHFSPYVDGNPGAAGANLLWLCGNSIRIGCVAGDEKLVRYGARLLQYAFPTVTEGDGFYEDGSFIQHTYSPYSGSYGVSMMSSLMSVLYMVSGTAFQPTYPEVNNIYNWFYEGYEPIIYKGSLMNMVRGREIARSYSTEATAGKTMLSTALTLATISENAGRTEDALRSACRRSVLLNLNVWVMITTAAGITPTAYHMCITGIIWIIQTSTCPQSTPIECRERRFRECRETMGIQVRVS